ncbi:hypothetical protein [Streptomyces vinaceus]|uniref:hypothetical protein n=1 Tax=Streptomyces vinaceus TaxID=1960 RepID=UPI00382B65FF
MDIQHAPPSGFTPDIQFELEITSNEEVRGLTRFEGDLLAFRIEPRPDSAALEVRVELRESLDGFMGSTLLGGTGSVRIADRETQPSWICFSGFGWEDERRTRPVSTCYYSLSISGDSTVRIQVWGEEIDF